jgi:hypothetical protein
VRRDALQLRGDDPEVLRALRHVDLADQLGRAHVGELAGHRGNVVGLRRDRGVLRVGERLRQLLVAAVEVADDRIDADDLLAFEREDGAKHAVGGGVLRPHVHGEPFAAGVIHLDPARPVGAARTLFGAARTLFGAARAFTARGCDAFRAHLYGGCGVSTA